MNQETTLWSYGPSWEKNSFCKVQLIRVTGMEGTGQGQEVQSHGRHCHNKTGNKPKTFDQYTRSIQYITKNDIKKDGVGSEIEKTYHSLVNNTSRK